MKRVIFGFTLLMFVLLGSFSLFGGNGEAARGSHLVIIGGALGSSDGAGAIYEEMVHLSGGSKGKIGVITASSYPYDWDCEDPNFDCDDPNVSNSKMNANYYIESFNEFGIDAEWVPVDIANIHVADDEEWAQRIGSGEFTGFFLGGGDQSRYITSFIRESADGKWEDSAVLAAIREQFEKGRLMIAGSSAGAAILPSDAMVTGGDSYRAITSGPIYEANGGFGFFSYGLVDSHFSERAREARMIRLATEVGVDKIYGIDETTALVVRNANHPSVQMEVVGEYGVQILDVSNATVSDVGGNWAIEGVTSTYLNHGDRYHPNQGTVVFNSNGKPLHGGDAEVRVSYSDILYATNAYRDMAWDLLSSNEETAIGYSHHRFENTPQYALEVEKTKQTKARENVVFGRTKISFENLEISISPLNN